MTNYMPEVQCAPQRAEGVSSQLAIWGALGEGSSALDPLEVGGIALGESESGDMAARKGERLTSVELCAGAGGQALGLHNAGFAHVALVELDKDACSTLRHNGRPWGWAECVHQANIRTWVPPPDLEPISLVSAGVPCPPFSIAGKQLGQDDERDLFPALMKLVEIIGPRAVQAENVRGLLSGKFAAYRESVERRLNDLGYLVSWRLLNACDFGVSQLRPRTVMVALRPGDAEYFAWPEKASLSVPTVGQRLLSSMSSKGWEGAATWAELANGIAPTLVGGSRKHGGPDLGPTRARVAWAGMGVDGRGISDSVPGPGFKGMPKLTVEQAAALQGFPDWWEFQGRKTSAYRQVGNAFPPPVAEAVGRAVARAIAQGLADEVAA